MILGAVIGFLIGLAFCYWKQLQSAYENRDIISSGANLVGAGQQFYDDLRKKL